MRGMALLMIMTILLAPLAGCAGTDGDITVDLSTEELQDLIDDNKQDFLNNTTVVVFQDYHNNTTVVNQYSNNSTSSIDQSGASSSSTTYNYNGTNLDPETFVVRVVWDWSDIVNSVTQKRNNNFTVTYFYYDYATNNDRNDTFTLACSNYYDAPAQSNNSSPNNNVSNYWQDNDNYYPWWDYLYNNTIRDLLGDVAYSNEVENVCRESGDSSLLIDNSDYYAGNGNYDYSSAFVFHELLIPNGTALKIIDISSSTKYVDYWGFLNTQPISWTLNGIMPNGCYDLSNIVNYYQDECSNYYGGWEDIHLSFQLRNSVYADSEFAFTMYYQIVPVTNIQ